MPLNTALNLADPDGFYQMLVEAHRDVTAEAGAALNARLVLLLANHIGDAAVIQDALSAAIASAPPSSLQANSSVDQ